MGFIRRKKGNKYNNTKCEFEGLKFDSKKERDRYIELKQMQENNLIKDLKLQVKFVLFEKFKDQFGKTHREIAYIADFTYFDIEDDTFVVEDLKSRITERETSYRMKRKMMIYKLLKMQEKEGVQYEFREVIK